MHEQAHELAMALRGAYLTMHRRADAYLARHGVTADQFVLLNLLAQESEVTQQTLVVRAFSDPNTVRTMLVLLEGRGLVTRKRHPVDGRARSVSLTGKGRKAVERIRSACRPFYDRLLSDYRPEEVQTLLGLLGRIPPVMTARDAPEARRQASTTPEAP
jgi:MarR family transcriptional regulator, lower aerobic nicotinate degradation pathway regulator